MGDAAVIGSLRSRLGTRSPFEWLQLTPAVTLPLSALLIFTVGGTLDAQALGLVEVEWTRENRQLDQTHYFYFDFWVIWAVLTVPGVVNLPVAWWLRHELTYVRIAAGLALTLALLRTFVVPMASVLWLTGDVMREDGLILRIPIGEAGASSAPSPSFATLSILMTAWMGGLGMWVLTLVIWQAYEPLMSRFVPHLAPPRERSQGEPGRWGGFFQRQ